MRIILAFIFISAPAWLVAQPVLKKVPATGTVLTDFIPAGYDTLATASGDLNKDGQADLVLALHPGGELNEDGSFPENIDSIPPRLLILLFKTATGYKVAAKSAKAILCRHCGGVFGDPFQSIEVTKGVLTLSHYGGSAWRWGYQHKFRYQKNGVFLIGETKTSYWNVNHCDKLDEFAGTDYMDINYLTGQYEQKKVSAEGCKLLLNKKGKKPVKPLTSFNTFKIDN